MLAEPRLRRHMPLSTDLSRAEVADWVVSKDAQWEANGFGPWAVLVDGALAGWAGFQAEEAGADLAVVLLPQHWGLGLAVVEKALERGFGELGLDTVLIALPRSRNPDRVVGGLGFVPDGETTYGAVTFRRYRLTRDAWRRARVVPAGVEPRREHDDRS